MPLELHKQWCAVLGLNQSRLAKRRGRFRLICYLRTFVVPWTRGDLGRHLLGTDPRSGFQVGGIGLSHRGAESRSDAITGPLAFISRSSFSTLSWWFPYDPSSRDGPSGCCIAYHKLSRRLSILLFLVGIHHSTIRPTDLRLSVSKSAAPHRIRTAGRAGRCCC